MRLVIVWATIENVQAHVRAPKFRRKTERISILLDIPKLTRYVGTLG
jgi:hypothetical protein